MLLFMLMGITPLQDINRDINMNRDACLQDTNRDACLQYTNRDACLQDTNRAINLMSNHSHALPFITRA